jgi:hypothetical protein
MLNNDGKDSETALIERMSMADNGMSEHIKQLFARESLRPVTPRRLGGRSVVPVVRLAGGSVYRRRCVRGMLAWSASAERAFGLGRARSRC